jgi:TorA maturation chaperone TorD
MKTIPREIEKNTPAARIALAESCRLLAACFYPPDEKLFVQEGITIKLGSLLETACPEAMPLVPPLEKYLEGEGGVNLAVAYTRLFLGPPAMLAPPYASFYLDKGAVMGPSSIAMMKLYSTAGLRLDDEFNEMPDHVAVALEFLYYLIFKETNAGSNDAREEKEKIRQTETYFLNKFIFPWIPRFCDRIAAADEHPFYTDLGKCLSAFIGYGFMPAGQPRD